MPKTTSQNANKSASKANFDTTTLEPAFCVGQETELEISDFNTDGSAVARKDGMVFFIDKGIIGDKISARVTAIKKRVAEAALVRVISPSAATVEAFCPHFGTCGGCNWQNMDYSAQLKWKEARVRAALERIAKINCEVRPVLASPQEQEYRNKVAYAFAPSNEGFTLGLHRRSGKEVVSIERCFLQSETSGKILQVVREWGQKNKLKAWDGSKGSLRFFILREPQFSADGTPVRMAELICSSAAPGAESAEKLWNALNKLGVESFSISTRKAAYALARGEKTIYRFGKSSLLEKFGELTLAFPAVSFMQTNTAAAALLYAEAAKAAQGKKSQQLWDIYSGIGAFSLYLAPGYASVVGVESDNTAVKLAVKNAARLGYENCNFIAGDAATTLPKLPTQPETVLVDPPRSGLNERVRESIIKKKPTRIVYVSCDAASLARDLAAFGTHYKIEYVQPVDLFPHTAHVENVALLLKK